MKIMNHSPAMCTNCGCEYPPEGLPYRCPNCGGLFDITDLRPLDSNQKKDPMPGIWRYQQTFHLPREAKPIYLGEGDTPLVHKHVLGRDVYFKCEYQNPSGSFKDRGSALIVAWMKVRKMIEAVEDSSGNAGASLACYAAYTGIKATIFVPSSTSGCKQKQIEAYGAQLVSVNGSRKDVAEAACNRAKDGVAYASHAYLPFNIPGYATVAYELYEQLGEKMPGAVICPVGQGGLLLGLIRGFKLLKETYCLPRIPSIIGVQARSCAPLWALFTGGRAWRLLVAEKPTMADGIRIHFPVRGDAVIFAMHQSSGSFIAVSEDEITEGWSTLAQLGFYVEPTSAVIWPALLQAIHDLRDPIVIILTGSGLKYCN